MKEFIDKLISRLEEASRTMMPVIPTEEAINIVTELAEEYNNDFCEHILGSGVTSCGKIFRGDSESGKCPYCGKKIKVVHYTEGDQKQ